jgi:Fe-S cluster biogenesis protein NfuA/nitrite reductase/ring-hydroxylating ferredoxin subunit
MATTASTSPEQLVGLVQELQERLDAAEPSPAKELAEGLVGGLVQMYGAGLEHIVSSLQLGGEDGRDALRAMAEDPLLGALLLIHDLHPVSLQERVDGALEQVRPYMESHGGDVELLSLHDGVARIRLRGSCSDCAASTVTLELAIKQALEQAAPDLEGLEVEGVGVPAAAAGPTLPLHEADSTLATLPIYRVEAGAPSAGALELPMAATAAGAEASSAPAGGVAQAPSWQEVAQLDGLPVGELTAAEVAGAELVVANVDGTLLAYRDRCAACGAPLHGGELLDGALRCPDCARTFFLPRAGRSLDDDRIQLEPVPLLRDQGGVKVALLT